MLPKIIKPPKSLLCRQKYLFYNSLQNLLCHPKLLLCHQKSLLCRPKIFTMLHKIITLSPKIITLSPEIITFVTPKYLLCCPKSLLCHPPILMPIPIPIRYLSTNAIRITSPFQSPCSNTKSLSYHSSITLLSLSHQ